MLIKLLTPVILKTYEFYNRILGHKNYEIIYRSLTYEIDPDEEYIISSDFWYDESQHWSHYNTSHYVDITKKDISQDPIPENVKNCVVTTKYYYNNRIYKYVSRGLQYSWPPRDSSDGIFFPIVCAKLMNDACETTRDVTDKIKRYAGPKSNFYGEEILIRDIFSYDDETMKKEYPYLVISDVFGNTRAFKTDQSLDFVAK
jgi:hypothetical protein